MKRITEFLGKPVISLLEGNIEGYVKNVVFDKTLKKVKYLVIFEDNEFQDEKMLETSKIFNIGENAIVIKNNSCLELVKQEALPITNHINCKVYTTLGKYVGIIADIEINNDFATQSVLLTNQTILYPSNFLSFGQDIFVMQDASKIVKIANIKKRDKLVDLKNTANISKVSIMPTNKQNVTLSSAENLTDTLIETTKVQLDESDNENRKKYEFNNSSIPKKMVVNNSDFLIGRKTTKTIYSASNEVVVRKNVIINQKIIQQAILFNKLRELSIYSA